MVDNFFNLKTLSRYQLLINRYAEEQCLHFNSRKYNFFGNDINQARWNEIHIGGLKLGESEASKNGGLGKFFMTTPFRSLENAPFLEILPLKEAKDHDW